MRLQRWLDSPCLDYFFATVYQNSRAVHATTRLQQKAEGPQAGGIRWQIGAESVSAAADQTSTPGTTIKRPPALSMGRHIPSNVCLKVTTTFEQIQTLNAKLGATDEICRPWAAEKEYESSVENCKQPRRVKTQRKLCIDERQGRKKSAAVSSNKLYNHAFRTSVGSRQTLSPTSGSSGSSAPVSCETKKKENLTAEFVSLRRLHVHEQGELPH